MQLSINSKSLEDTLALGQAIGHALKGGETIDLSSDLGGGKTALTKGIAAGMGSSDTVQSPTFTISRIYRCTNDRELHHFDFYRLNEPGVMAAELTESLNDPQAVVVVEWSDIVEGILPDARLQIFITATEETARKFTITLPDAYTEVVAALKKFQEEHQ